MAHAFAEQELLSLPGTLVEKTKSRDRVFRKFALVTLFSSFVRVLIIPDSESVVHVVCLSV
jgi:hypothetical protein